MEIQELKNLIRFHRKKSSLTQAELGKLAGLGKTVVFDIENGKTTVKIETFFKILKVLNIQMEFKSPLMELYEKS